MLSNCGIRENLLDICYVSLLFVILLLFIISRVSVSWGSKYVLSKTADELTADDMKLTADQIRTTKLRNAYIMTNKWPNGIVPYALDTKIAQDTAKRRAIESAINKYTTSTCIQWVPRTTEKNYVQFINGGSGQCYSSVGMINSSPQQISIGDGCESVVGISMHEMMHTMGFMHEHMRPDRDEFITVDTAKIQKSMTSQFTKLSATSVDEQNLAYDYLSVMHYPGTSFSSDGSRTIITKDPSYQNRIGQRSGLSKCDLEKLNKYYNCTSKLTFDPACRLNNPPIVITKPTVPPVLNVTNTNSNLCVDSNPSMCKLSNRLCANYPGHYMVNCKKLCNNCDGKRCIDTNIAIFQTTCRDIQQNARTCTDQLQKMLCPKACKLC